MSLPKCPYCSHEFDLEEIYYTGETNFPTENDGDEEHTECSNCKKPLLITVEFTPEWRFIDEDGEDIS